LVFKTGNGGSASVLSVKWFGVKIIWPVNLLKLVVTRTGHALPGHVLYAHALVCSSSRTVFYSVC